MSRGTGKGWKCQKKQKNAQEDKTTSLMAPYFNSLNKILEPLASRSAENRILN